MKIKFPSTEIATPSPKNTISLAELCLIHEAWFTVRARPKLMTWMDDQSAHFVVSKSALIPQIQTQVLSHHKKNRQIP